MRIPLLFLLTISLSPLSLPAQFYRPKTPYVETIDNAKKEGITIQSLDSKYKSAVHTDPLKAVFVGAKEDSLISAYTRFLQDFLWQAPTRCWNRIYFHADGTVDYYLFDFKSTISNEKIARFKELFKAYAGTHKIGITASTNFAQCSPVTYMDK
jgi:hypothetical protein